MKRLFKITFRLSHVFLDLKDFLLNILRMLGKAINAKCFKLLLLLAFCLSSSTLLVFLPLGSEVHFENGSVHIHHGNEDHGLGEADHSDANIVLHLDYLTIKSSGLIKACPVINLFIHTHFYPEYHRNFSEISSVHHSSINRFCSTSLYQLNSSYLI